MLVKDAINGIGNGQITRKQLAKKYVVSTRTISNKIRNLGYVYNNKTKTYTYTGDDLKTDENTDFGHLFRQNQRIYANITPTIPQSIKSIPDLNHHL